MEVRATRVGEEREPHGIRHPQTSGGGRIQPGRPPPAVARVPGSPPVNAGSSPRWAIWVLFLAAALSSVWAAAHGGPRLPGGVLAYALLSFGPGAALFLLLRPRQPLLELILASLVASPVLVVAAGAPLLLAGATPRGAALLVVAATAALGLWALRPGRPAALSTERSGRQLLVLFATLVVFCLLVGVLPLTRSWWRMRADAWFHGAVVAEIAAFGLPPHDPYFVGMPLQYMWFYHALVLLLSRASAIPPLVVMPLLNLQALSVFALGAFLVSAALRKGFASSYWAMLTAVFGMNALYWVFLIPLVILRAFSGTVRGMAEVARLLSLHPFSADRIRTLLHIYYNQEFLLDKFLVATALTLGLGFIAGVWYGTVRYLETRQRQYLVLVFLSAAGMLGFHPLTGVLAAGGILGGLFFLFLRRRGVDGYRIGPSAAVAAAVIGAGLLLLPYLVSITRAKEGEQLLPFSLSVAKLGGLAISLALVVVLAAFQVRRLVRSRSAGVQFLLAGTIALFLVSLVIRLPGPNTYDKLPFLLFFPLAVVGGWSLADFTARARPRRRPIRAVLVFLALFAPLNGLTLAAYYHSPAQPPLQPDEWALTDWVRGHTPRDAVFFDSGDRVILLVPGPRRYYWGLENYAEQWGYDKAEMARRRHVRDNLYSTAPLDSTTLSVLGTMPAPTYLIARGGDPGSPGPERFHAYPDLFRVVFSSGNLFLFQVDREACRLAARRAPSSSRSERAEHP